MMTNDRHNRIVKIHSAENLCSDNGVHLHLLELWSSQLSRLVQDVIRYCDLTDIVQQSARLERFDVSVITTHQARDTGCVNLHAQHMFVSDCIFGIDRNRQGFDGFAMRLFQQLNALVHVISVLTVTKINCDQDRRADDNHDQPVVLQSKISKAGDRTGGQGNRRGPGQILLPGAEEIGFTAQGKKTRQQSHINQNMDRSCRQQSDGNSKE